MFQLQHVTERSEAMRSFTCLKQILWFWKPITFSEGQIIAKQKKLPKRFWNYSNWTQTKQREGL